MKEPLENVPRGRRWLLARLRRLHAERFGRRPEFVAFAPGRIEVLGNHTDYNEGLALAAALSEGVGVALSRAARRTRLYAAERNQEVLVESGVEASLRIEAPWTSYILGVAALLAERGADPGSFDATIAGDLPIGAGLSSSAALEVSAALALAAVAGDRPRRLDLARLCRRAEWEYAGVRCGLMDQMTSLFARRGHLLGLDFRTLRIRQVSFPEHACFLVCVTPVRHSLADSAYNERRRECEQALGFFAGRIRDRDITALRDVSRADWEKEQAGLDDVPARRARHVIDEIERVRQGETLLSAGDLEGFGRLMSASHRSSSKLFENSTPELDTLVRVAETTPGVFGARLSGGGFGGNVLVLAKTPQAAAAARRIEDVYRTRFGRGLKVIRVQPSRGAALALPNRRKQALL